MTEQEIVDYLKENKNKGIAYMFLPEDVRDWVHDNIRMIGLKMLDSNGSWSLTANSDFDFDDYDNVVFALPDDYQVKREPKGEWVEFEIDQKGRFRCFIKDFMFYFFWANWNTFLAEAYSSGYTAFGGWQYKDCEIWYMTPQVFLDDHYVNVVFKGEDRVKPAIPVKIRFWRENK